MAAGFVGFEITWRKDVFSDAPQAGSAEKFGTLGINFRARKAASEEEWVAALAALVEAIQKVTSPKFRRAEEGKARA